VTDKPDLALPAWLPRRLSSVPEAAEILHVNPRTVWRLIADGKLRILRIRGAVRIPPEALAALLQ
jgi:excisionase family DNA binding protein